MGDWRTVNILGTISEEDVMVLRQLLDKAGTPSWRASVWSELWACLSYDSASPSLAGLGEWPYQIVNACGNLAERNFSVDDVAQAIQALAEKAPSMHLKIHCGGPYESEGCVATITVAAGLAAISPPEVEIVAPASEDQVKERLWAALGKKIFYPNAGDDPGKESPG